MTLSELTVNNTISGAMPTALRGHVKLAKSKHAHPKRWAWHLVASQGIRVENTLISRGEPSFSRFKWSFHRATLL